MTNDQRDLFEEHVLGELESPCHRGRLDRPTCARTLRNPACGDQVRLELLLDPAGRIREAWHEASGCLFSRAAASHLCRAIEGRMLVELRHESPAALIPLLQLPLTPLRRQCTLLPFATLQALMEQLP